MKKILSAALLIMISTNLALAQNFAPDRPGIGNGSFITPSGTVGIEAGIQYYHDPLVDEFNIGELLLRFGVSDKAELRAGLGSFTTSSRALIGGRRDYSGFQDISLGAKFNLISGADKPSLSALAEFSLPVGSSDYTSDEFIPTVGFLLDQDLSRAMSISSNIGYSFKVGNVDDIILLTVTPGFPIPANDTISAFFGYTGMYYGNGFNEHWIEGGFTFALQNGIHLDVNMGYETEGESVFLGAGFAKGF